MALSYRIYGYVKTPNFRPITGITICIIGPNINLQVVTDVNGYYSQSVSPNDYTVTPIAPDGVTYSWSPSSAQITVSDADVLQNFSGTRKLVVSGCIRNVTGAPYSSVIVAISGNASGSTQTDANGFYSFTVDLGGNYTITPQSPQVGGFSFNPPNRSYSNLQANQFGQDFTILQRITVTGSVKFPSGTVMSGVTIQATGGASGSVLADDLGNYALLLIPTGPFTVRPSFSGCFFDPVQRDYTIIQSYANQDYTGYGPVDIYGYVNDRYGIPQAGITVALGGDATLVTSTDEIGYYRFSGLKYGGTYKLTAGKPGGTVTFEPSSVTLTGVIKTELVKFTLISDVKVSGHVYRSDGKPFVSVGVNLIATDPRHTMSAQVTTDAAGYFEFGIYLGMSVYLECSYYGNTFSPARASLGAIQRNTTQNFTGYSWIKVDGHITLNGSPLAGVTLRSSGDINLATSTDANGYYVFYFTRGMNVVITPEKAGYTFSPANRNYSNLTVDQATQDYTAAATTVNYVISGYVRLSNGRSVQGVPIELNIAGQISTVGTDGSGYYSFIVPAGSNCIVSVAASWLIVDPTSRSFNNLSSNQSDQNFTVWQRFKISGHIKDQNGQPVSLVNMGSTQTDANGYYEIYVKQGDNCIITPSLYSYSFTPSQRIYTLISSDQMNQDYTAVQANIVISGQVLSSNGSPLQGITVQLSGYATASQTTDNNGYYYFNVVSGGNYTVTPSNPNYTFSPANRSYSNIKSSTLSQNFQASPVKYAISGHILDNNGLAMQGVLVSLKGSDWDNATTDVNGFFTLHGSSGQDYDLVPSKSGYTLTPGSIHYTALSADQVNQNFTGAPVTDKTFILSGSVKTVSGTLVQGVTLTLSGNMNDAVTTDVNGNYSFTVKAGNYTITPSGARYTFNPTSINLYNVSAFIGGNDFTATIIGCFIEGRVMGSNGTPLKGIGIDLSGSVSGHITTDETGRYRFQVSASGNYTITPSSNYYNFSPTQRTYSDLQTSQYNQNFTATQKRFLISGSIKTIGGVGIQGVVVWISGDESGMVATDANGNYGVYAHVLGHYYIEPRLEGYGFDPTTREIQSLTGDTAGQDFTGAPPIKISGYVRDAGSNPLAGVDIIVSGKTTTSAMTNENGYYEVMVQIGGPYDIQPRKIGYLFSPAITHFNSLTADQLNVNFTITTPVAISGRVTLPDGTAIVGAVISVSGDMTFTVTTDTDGYFQVVVAHGGNYTITPSKPNTNLMFEPMSRSYSAIAADQVNQNLTAYYRVVIEGYITKRNGSPVSGVSVNLKRN